MKYRLHPWVILRARMPAVRPCHLPGPLSMYDECPGCGLDFDRGQPGYFTGAMYVSYALGIPLIALLTLIEYLLFPSWSLFRLVLAGLGDLPPLHSLDLAVLPGDLDPLRSVGRPRGRRQPQEKTPIDLRTEAT